MFKITATLDDTSFGARQIQTQRFHIDREKIVFNIHLKINIPYLGIIWVIDTNFCESMMWISREEFWLDQACSDPFLVEIFLVVTGREFAPVSQFCRDLFALQ